MAYFDYSKLKDDMVEKTGYTLFSDFGEVTDALGPHRVVNEIITPVVGVFRLNPVPLTALTTPYIAVVSASIEIPAPLDKAEEVRKNLNDMAAKHNATTERMNQEDTTFTIVYSFETCVVSDKRRDVSIYGGEIVIISQTVTFTIIEKGITALDTELKINGLPVPFLRFDETRVATSETTPNDDGHGEVAVTQEMYGITFDTPLIDNQLGDMLLDAINNGTGNKAYAVEVTRNGKTSVYLMAIGTIATSANPPANIGVSVSMAEINPMAAQYSDIFKTATVSGTVGYFFGNDRAVFWGDGHADKLNGKAIHVYRDGKKSHKAFYLDYADTQRFGDIVVGAELLGKTIRPKNAFSISSTTPATVLVTMTSGDKLEINGRLRMVIDGIALAVDDYSSSVNTSTASYAFTSYMRGKVATVNESSWSQYGFEYDRWAVGEED